MGEPPDPRAEQPDDGSYIAKEFIDAFRKWRKTNNVKLVDAAKYTGMSIASISRIERGLQSPTLRMIAIMAAMTEGAIRVEFKLI